MKRAVGVIIFAALTATGNAQFFVEGSVDVDYQKTDATYYGWGVAQPHKPAYNMNYGFSPVIGYWLNDHIAVGTKVSFSTEIRKRSVPEEDAIILIPDLYIDFVCKQPNWSFGIFGRYKIWGTEKLSFLVETSVFISGGYTIEKMGSVEKKTDSRSSFGLETTPFITYDISDKWSIISRYDFLRFSLSYITEKNEITDQIFKRRSFDFKTDNFFHLPFNLGFIYHF